MSGLYERLFEAIEAEEGVAKAAWRLDWSLFATPSNLTAATFGEVHLAFIAAHDPATTLRRLAEDRDVLTRHAPIQGLVSISNGGSEWMTLCAYEWGDGDGHLLRWEQCPEIASLARRHGLDP